MSSVYNTGVPMSLLSMQILAFVVFSLALVALSWQSLRKRDSHGFYRFLAWEAMLPMALLNLPVWFVQPFAPLQIISWMLLFASLVWLGLGLKLIQAGVPGAERGDASLLAFEKTSQLVTTGIYGYIRHPLYGSLLLLTWGLFFKGVNGYTFVLAALATGFLVATARADERECIAYFGAAYRDYMKRTKRFVPFLF